MRTWAWSRDKSAAIAVLGALLLVVSCSSKRNDGDLVLPRGATIAVRLDEAIGADQFSEGSPFRARLDGPLSLQQTVFVPAGAWVEGVVDEIEKKSGSPTEITIHLTRIQLSSGVWLPMETRPISRSSRRRAPLLPGLSAGNAAYGIEAKVKFLAETGGPALKTSSTAGGAASLTSVFPKDGLLVFSLDSDLVVPKP